MNKDICVLSW